MLVERSRVPPCSAPRLPPPEKRTRKRVPPPGSTRKHGPCWRRRTSGPHGHRAPHGGAPSGPPASWPLMTRRPTRRTVPARPRPPAPPRRVSLCTARKRLWHGARSRSTKSCTRRLPGGMASCQPTYASIMLSTCLRNSWLMSDCLWSRRDPSSGGLQPGSPRLVDPVVVRGHLVAPCLVTKLSTTSATLTGSVTGVARAPYLRPRDYAGWRVD